jgi:threonine dehydratase
MNDSVTRAHIDAARKRLDGYAVKTPLLRFPVLDEATGGTILVKPENLQRTGSFKFRGAYNRISRIPEEIRANGVVACSSGNHAQGVAESARILGIPATIVMPADAPAIKLQRTRGFGARVITYDRATEDREAIADGLCAESGATFVHPYNDPEIIAGQGTVGAEIADQARALGLEPDAVVACTGGGGLSGGVALALESGLPEARFYTVEPEGFDDYARSLAQGERLANPQKSGSVCDALLSEMPGERGFAILHRLGVSGLTVSDQEALAAVAFAFLELKLVVEPGGAVALAALLNGRIPTQGRTLAVVLTGGNIDEAMMQRALSV